MNSKAKRTLTALCLGAAVLTVAPGAAGAAEDTAAIMSYSTGHTEIMVSENSALPATSAGPQISDKKAVDILKKAFPDLDWSGDPQISLSSGRGQYHPAWNISVYRSNRYGGRSEGFNAIVDGENGDILNLYLTAAQGQSAGDIISREKAQYVAESFARRMHPDKMDYLRLKTEPYPGRYNYNPSGSLSLAYSFFWERTAGGLAVDSDGLWVSVDALSGRVISYSYSWRSDLKLPSSTPSISAREAAQKLMDQSGMYLCYFVPGSDGAPSGTPRARLVYRLNSSSLMLDAGSSQLLDYQGRPVENPRQVGDIPDLPGEMNPPAPSAERISPSAALDKARKFFQELGYQGELEQNGSGSGSGPLGREEYWNFSPVDEKQPGYYAPPPSVGIEVFSGRVSHFNDRFMASPDENEKSITHEKALEKARSFVQKVEPDLSGHLALNSDSAAVAGDRYYRFRFSRVVNGIVFPQDGVSITLTGTGKIIEYNCAWHRVEFPAARASVTADDAASAWLEKSPLKLAYFFPMDDSGQPLPARLVYRPESDGLDCIDAVSGDPLGWNGQVINGAPAEGYDFSGSWAGSQLRLLAESGLLPTPESFSPGSPVTRRDGMRLIMAASGSNYYGDQISKQHFSDITPSDADYALLQRAADMGIIAGEGQFQPGEPLDRKTLALWLVNRLGYEEVASMPSLVESPFRDIASLPLKDRNCIGLANGLGLMTGDNSGYFRPADSVSWEELAAVVLKLPASLKGRDMMY